MSLFKTKHKVAAPIFAPLECDIHCHLVPAVDDGSKSAEESATCMRIMKEAGFSEVFITPHYQYPRFPNEESDIERRFSELKLDLDMRKDSNLPHLSGVAGEYRIDSIFKKRIEEDKFLLVGGRYLLTELSLHQVVMGLDQFYFDLQMKNHEIILAHPERYPYFTSSASQLEKFKDMGVLFQVNILSLSGFYGESPRRKAFEMIENGWVEFLGTDMHNTIYAQALIDASHDRKIEKLLSKHTFKNHELLHPQPVVNKKL